MNQRKRSRLAITECLAARTWLSVRMGSVRYFSVREAARLPDFPDEYEFSSVRGRRMMRQLGNAVPVRLAKVVASSVARTLLAMEGQG